ncbi:MAG TPA: hypothetical protein VEK08_11020 [Planctomycetota bacterium]|nr:hypothetical protein [Planctomycetota bacterium]
MRVSFSSVYTVGLLASWLVAVWIPQTSAGERKTGLENSPNWAVETWGNSGEIRQLKDDERTTLVLYFDGGDKEKTAFVHRPGFAVPKDGILRAWVFAEEDNGPKISFAAGTGLEHTWHESKLFELKKGWNKIEIPLAAPNWKTKASNWQFTEALAAPNDVRYVDVLVHNGKRDGKIMIERLFEPPEVSADEKKLDDPEAWRAEWKRISRLGDGFIAWESNRSGAFRVWSRGHDGSPERMLSKDEPGRDHHSPTISPDGTRILYLSVDQDRIREGSYRNPRHVWSMRMVRADGSDDQELIANVRSYWGERFAVWQDEQTIIYIDPDGVTKKRNLKTGKDEILLSPFGASNPWLVDPKEQFAIRGYPPQFSRYDAASRRVTTIFAPEGCMPFFSYDGKWGVWMNGSGGPVSALHLSDAQQRNLIQRSDPRFPRSRNFVYFPNLSRCGRLFVCCASPNQFEHFTSDFDVFVMEFDAEKFAIAGKPVRYTFDGKSDIYPDVYLKPHPLGYQRGEAPFNAAVKLPEDGAWQIDFGDGQQAQFTGNEVQHLYERAGEFSLRAMRDGKELRGIVTVEPASPPRVSEYLITGETQMRVDFDEAVDVSQATFKLKAQGAPAEVQLQPGGRSWCCAGRRGWKPTSFALRACVTSSACRR